MSIVAHRRYSFHPPPSERVRAAVPDWTRVFEALGLRLRGRGLWLSGRCPLHDDRSPSFSANRETGFWRCWSGCGSGGVFDLVARVRGCSFREAVDWVAQVAGVFLDPPRSRSSAPRRWGAWQ